MTAQNHAALKQTAQQNPTQANQILRNQFAATSLFQDIPSPAQGLALNMGGATQIVLNNLGYLIKLLVRVEFAYTAGAALSLSPAGLFNAITNVTLKDFSGLQRHNAPASAYIMRHSIRKRAKPFAHNPQLGSIGGSEVFGGATNFYDGTTNFTSMPSAGVASGANTGVIMFEIPVARDPDHADFTGMIDMQSTDGQVVLSLTTLAAAQFSVNGSDVSPFNGSATVTAATANVWVQQFFAQPQSDPAFNGIYPIPFLDVGQVYAFETQNWSTNLAQGSESRISLPNGRLIDTICARWFSNGYQGGNSYTNDLSTLRLVLNSANSIMQRDTTTQYAMQRDQITFDMGKGMYFIDFLGVKGSGKTAVKTQGQGNLQLGITPNGAITGTSYLEFNVISTYPNGSVIGGVIPN